MENPPVTAVAPPLHAPDPAPFPSHPGLRASSLLCPPRSGTAYTVAASEYTLVSTPLISTMIPGVTESIVTGSFSIFASLGSLGTRAQAGNGIYLYVHESCFFPRYF